MEVNLTRLAAAAEAVSLKLRATGEEQWWPLLESLSARLRAGDAVAAADLLEAIESPGGLAELEIGTDNAPYVTDADAATVNRQLRRHINHLNLLAGLAVPGSRWHQKGAATDGGSGEDDQWLDDDEGAEGRQPYDLQDRPEDSQDAYEPYPSRGPAESRTLEQRAGPLPPGPIDWFRAVFHGLCGAVTGAIIGLGAWPSFVKWGMPLDMGLMPLILGGAAIGCLLGAVWGHGFWNWLLGIGEYQRRWWPW